MRSAAKVCCDRLDTYRVSRDIQEETSDDSKESFDGEPKVDSGSAAICVGALSIRFADGPACAGHRDAYRNGKTSQAALYLEPR